MADDKAASPEPVKVQFHFIKGPSYREGACHGAVGGPTPQGKIWMALYSERFPLPRSIEYHISPPSEGTKTVQFDEKNAGPPASIDSRQGVVRIVEFGAYLDVQVAESLRDWLDAAIKTIRAGGLE